MEIVDFDMAVLYNQTLMVTIIELWRESGVFTKNRKGESRACSGIHMDVSCGEEYILKDDTKVLDNGNTEESNADIATSRDFQERLQYQDKRYEQLKNTGMLTSEWTIYKHKRINANRRKIHPKYPFK